MRKPLTLFFAVLFLLFVAVQYNDPDPQVWMPIYGLAVMACLMAYARTGQPWFFWGMALIYAGAAVYQWPPVFEGFWLNQTGMKSMNVELAREAGGLAICAGAMALFGYFSRRYQRT